MLTPRAGGILGYRFDLVKSLEPTTVTEACSPNSTASKWTSA